MSTRRRCLSLAKGRHHYVFRYHDDQEARVLASLVQLAAQPGAGFNGLDAVLLAYQMGKRIGNTKRRYVGIPC